MQTVQNKTGTQNQPVSMIAKPTRQSPASCYRSRLRRAVGKSWAQFVKRHQTACTVATPTQAASDTQERPASSDTLVAIGLQRDMRAITAYVAKMSRTLPRGQ